MGNQKLNKNNSLKLQICPILIMQQLQRCKQFVELKKKKNETKNIIKLQSL